LYLRIPLSFNLEQNERYIELTALLLDAKEEATQAKREGDRAKQKQASQKVREFVTGKYMDKTKLKIDVTIL